MSKRTEKALLAVKRKRETKLNQSRKPERRWLKCPATLEEDCYIIYPWAGVRRIASNSDELKREVTKALRDRGYSPGGFRPW